MHNLRPTLEVKKYENIKFLLYIWDCWNHNVELFNEKISLLRYIMMHDIYTHLIHLSPRVSLSTISCAISMSFQSIHYFSTHRCNFGIYLCNFSPNLHNFNSHASNSNWCLHYFNTLLCIFTKHVLSHQACVHYGPLYINQAGWLRLGLRDGDFISVDGWTQYSCQHLDENAVELAAVMFLRSHV